MTLRFSISSIPHGKSTRTVPLKPEDMPEFPEDVIFSEGELVLNFEKTDHFLKADCSVKGVVTLRCDRSLREFQKTVRASYMILFKPDALEETETDQSAIRQIHPGDTEIDLSREIRDTILLSLPLQRVHPDFIDEHGKIKEYQTKTFGTFGDSENETDPRWDALKKLSEPDEEKTGDNDNF